MKSKPIIENIQTKNFLKNNLPFIILTGLFIFNYLPTFLVMWDHWFERDSYYSHGILIPFISGFLIWQKREELKEIPFQSSRWGIPLIIAGVCIQLLSALFRVNFSSDFSMLLVLIGMILHFFGKKILYKIRFPIAFLIFMVPMPEVVIANISFKMKIFATHLATIVLNHMRMPALQKGSIILMRHAQVQVEDICSGLRSLISLMALGSIFAYWMKTSLWKRIFLFLSTMPIAIITNVCRIVFLAAVSEIWGAQYAEGLVHDIAGFTVFGLAFILLFAMGRLIE